MGLLWSFICRFPKINYICKPLNSVYMLKENYIKIYEDSFIRNWSKPALYDYLSKKRMTYGEMAAAIMRLHTLFRELHIQEGEKIALIGKNSSAWAIVFLAVNTYGGVIVPILDEFNPVDIVHILKHSEARLLFADEDIARKIDTTGISGLTGIVSLNGFSVLKEHDGSELQKIHDTLDGIIRKKYKSGYKPSHIRFAKRSNAELAMISYTSGTTSFTKGVMLSYNNLAGNVVFGIRNYRELGVKLERSLCVLPLAHTYGLAFSLLVHLAEGAEVTFLGKIPSPRIVTEACQAVRPNLLFFVPLILEKIYQAQIRPLIQKPAIAAALRIPLLNTLIYRAIGRKVYKALGGRAEDIIVGGAALNPEVEAFFYKTRLPFLVGYGLTECAPLVSYIHHPLFVPTSVGKALPNLMQVKILKERSHDNIGEIVVKGENVMMGYYKDPEATKKAFTADGWLRTGDLGEIDRDGNIYIKGRSKTLLLGPSGENIYPEAIESKLANLPYVAECLVVQNGGGRLEGWVYPDYDAMKEAGIEPDQAEKAMRQNLESLNQKLARYEQLNTIRIASEPFPKTPKRTIKRYQAEERIRQNQPE